MSDNNDSDTHAAALRELSRLHGRHPRWSMLAIAAGVLQTAATIALAAGIALFRFRINVIHVIATCALLGLAVRFLA